METLLAKSGDGAPTVAEHCRDVREAGDAVWHAVAEDLKSLVPVLPDSMQKLVAAAQLLHDILKANSTYQAMILSGGRTEKRQPVRHELLAAAFLTGGGSLAKWLAETVPVEAERQALVWAVAGHHFKMTDPARSPQFPLYRDNGAADEVKLYLSHNDVGSVLNDVAAIFGRHDTPTLTDLEFVTADDELRDRIDSYVSEADIAWHRLRALPANKTLIAMMKALVASADAAGSAITERGERPQKYVRDALETRLCAADLAPVVLRDTKGGTRPFQQRVADSTHPVTIVAAGCGNGKTTAAYLWAQKWADGKKLFFTYPTTGTATAGYGGYLADHQGLPTDLIHGRSEVDLAAIRAAREDDAFDLASRIDSLRAWSPKVIVCTVDTVLGLLQSQRRGVYSFPAFVAGAFVFDEIHACDEKLWGGLLRFLKEFPGVPALLMSASIPPHRQKQLQEILGDRAGPVIHGDVEIQGHKRYCLGATTEADAWDAVTNALKEKKKVLWVCNRVGDAIRIAQVAATHSPIIYHSRFRYRDRVDRQKTLISRFRSPGPLLAVTTQVCEMSLDISADLLITAECPLPSLVQRLGRLNRYAERDDPWPCLVYPFTGLPYNEDPKGVDLWGDCITSMAATRTAVKDLDGQPCSQQDLADRLNGMVDTETPEMYSALFDDGWVMEPMPVRDADQSVTVILTKDLSKIEDALGRNRKWWTAGKLAPWTVPMNWPKWLKPYTWETAGPYPIATAEVLDYHEQEGAQWAKNERQ